MDHTFWIPIGVSVFAIVWNLFQQKSIEKLKSANEKGNLIHRLQFEKEFNIYHDLWGKIVELRKCATGLRPIMDYYDSEETETERKKKRLNKLDKAYQECFDSLENNKPFYPEEVYTEINAVMKLSWDEAVEYRHGGTYWESAETNIKAIVDGYENITKIIRKRIGLIRIK